MLGDPAIGYTETHQVLVDVGYGTGPEVAERLEENNIIVNYQATPDEEGFTAIAAKFRGVGAVEKAHEERYRALLNNVEMQRVFEKSEETMWECRNCGHLVIGKKAPEVCPVCAHPQSYFEVRKENY